MKALALPILLLAGLVGCQCAATTPDAPVRLDSWAEPIDGVAGLPNLHRVSDVLYRGAQPDDAGFAQLEQMGVRTVVNLRSFNSDRDELEDTDLDYVHIYAKAWHPEDEEIVEFLRIVSDPARQPVFVHCQHGADRTGTFCALYRMAIQGWSAEDAVTEMTDGGYGFHAIWDELVAYVREADVAALKAEAGLE